ncbi:MAG: phenylacetate--CoA ligase family protein [Aquabacterium sp.]|uniref:phenylacetate--CoA ligase family protein n=1 Tax=Aquabacterium sp. TaxID=1872578 RepID=UPI0027195A8B|nr:phenylacetate--CoA ligase family protein [Aquabacterium sp.]MDO9005810.1 phenylacetate--CoA ligase family protein [Aquabacterium sp.]
MHAFDPWTGGIATWEAMAATVSSHATLKRLQSQRLTSLLTSAKGSALYRRILDGRPAGSLHLEDLPIMNKAYLMANFHDWVCDPRLELAALRQFIQDPSLIGSAYQGRFLVWESSGSHGAPGVFVQDAAAMAVYDALEATRRRVPNLPLHLLDPWGVLDRIAFVGATNGHFASTVSVERLRRLNPFLSRALQGISFLQPLPALARELVSFNPRVITTYPSVAIMLAEEKMRGKLDINPREIWTGGETLTDAMRTAISQAFNAEVINSYGASEFMSLAFECAHQRLHLNSDWAILEPVDEMNRPVPIGQVGSTTLLTNLANHVQPIIRYDLGDRVSIASMPCECGSVLPVIEVQGRSGDLLHLGDRHGQAAVSALALSTVVESIEELVDFQLIQTAPNELELNTELGGPMVDEALRRAKSALDHYLTSQNLGRTQVSCNAARPSVRGRNGKTHRVIGIPNHDLLQWLA